MTALSDPRPATRRLAFFVEYDGTGYAGWQRQPDGVSTVQETLEDAIADLEGGPVRVDGASRTDAGVHARGQWAAATIAHPIRVEGFGKAINKRLPDSIAIRGVELAPADHQPRFANTGKTYCYRLYMDRLRRPLLDRSAWRVPWTLDLDAMAAAMARCVGTHDFTSFAARDGTHHTAERTLTRCALVDRQDAVELWVEGTAFLKQMVRTLAGTWVDVGRGRRAPEAIETILAARDRQVAGPTAPGRGLTLERVHPRPGWAE